MISTELHGRLLAAVGDRTYRHLGELTKTHPETVRRYMRGQSPSPEFLAGLCSALCISGDWLLAGRGPMKLEEQRAQSLREAGPADLLAAMASNMEKLYERVDRLERYTQVLEVRLRTLGPPPDEAAPEREAEPPPVEIHVQVKQNGQSTRKTLSTDEQATDRQPTSPNGERAGINGEASGVNGTGASDGQAAPAAAPDRVRRVQRALAQRPRADAR